MEIRIIHSTSTTLSTTMSETEKCSLERVLSLALKKLILTPEEKDIVKGIHTVLLNKQA